MSSEPTKSNRVGISFSLKLTLFYAVFFIIAILGMFTVIYSVLEEFSNKSNKALERSISKSHKALEKSVWQSERDDVKAYIRDWNVQYTGGNSFGIKKRIGGEQFRKPRSMMSFWDEFSARKKKVADDKEDDVGRQTDYLFFRIIQNGRELFHYFPPSFKVGQLELASLPVDYNGLRIPIHTDETNAVWTVVSQPLDKAAGVYIQAAKNSSESKRFLDSHKSIFLNALSDKSIFLDALSDKSIFLKALFPILFIGLFVGWIITFRALQPVRNMIRTVRNILSTGDTSTTVPETAGHGEMHELVSTFNEMLRRNNSLMRGMHNSLDNVAHDLRTPMTRMRGVAEMALQKQDTAACYDALVDCMEESENVLTMLNTLMDVAEAETGAMKLDLVQVDVSRVLRKVFDLYEFVAEDNGIVFQADLVEPLYVDADPGRIQRCLANLIDNAIKYSGESGKNVFIKTRDLDDKVEVIVRDEGVGIAQGELEKIWHRLYRTDRSRSKRGLGLGLSFVKAIVEAHGGYVSVESELDKGTAFKVTLPKFNKGGS